MGHDQIDLPFDAYDGIIGLRHGLLSRAGPNGRLLGNMGHALGALGDLFRSHQQFVHGCRDLLHRSGLLPGTHALLIRSHLQLAG